MKKWILAMCMAVAVLFSPIVGECAEGYDCIQYIYGTWGVPHTDHIISFDYEGMVVPPEPGYMGKEEPPYARFPYVGIENAYINDTTRQGQIDITTTGPYQMHLNVLGPNVIQVKYDDDKRVYTFYRMSFKALSDEPDHTVVNK